MQYIETLPTLINFVYGMIYNLASQPASYIMHELGNDLWCTVWVKSCCSRRDRVMIAMMIGGLSPYGDVVFVYNKYNVHD